MLRKRTKIETIGHAGTLDPFATGVMIMLIGKTFTRLSDRLLSADKEYKATIEFGTTTDTYDIDGTILTRSNREPTHAELEQALLAFQGECLQVPPMFSAKKIKGQKLCDLARKGVSIEREPVKVHLSTHLLSYVYPFAELLVTCSKGTYIRSLTHDLGQHLGCGAFLSALTRTRSGTYSLLDCIDQKSILDPDFNLSPYLRKYL
jgi:tRNA pseudouridine55 synthase